MRVCIHGYPRSGSTMLAVMLYRHLSHAGVFSQDDVPYHDEPFTPHNHRTLYSNDGVLVHQEHPRTVANAIPQTREERWEIFKHHLNDPMFIKVMSLDLVVPTLPERIGEHFECYSIERRNTFSAFISALVAWRHRVWNVKTHETRPEYSRFEVQPHEMRQIGNHYILFHNAPNPLPVKQRFFYEDVVADPVGTLKAMGHYHEGAPIKSTFHKLHSFKEKMDLIANLDEVADYYQMAIAPLVPTSEATDL